MKLLWALTVSSVLFSCDMKEVKSPHELEAANRRLRQSVAASSVKATEKAEEQTKTLRAELDELSRQLSELQERIKTLEQASLSRAD